MTDENLLSMASPELFHVVKQAFCNAQDVLALAGSPLADCSLAASAVVPDDAPLEPADLGRAVQRVLRWTLNRMAPSPPTHPLGGQRPLSDPTWTQPMWLRYNILRHRYVEPLALDKAAGEEQVIYALLRRTSISSPGRYYRRRDAAFRDAAQIIRLALADKHSCPNLELDAITEFISSRHLPVDDQQVLDLAATFRGRFPRNWLAELARESGLTIADEALTRLTGWHLLLLEQDGTMFRVPARLQRYLCERPATEVSKRWHARAAEWRKGQSEYIETIWHLLKAERHGELADSIEGQISKLGANRLRELRDILARVPEDNLTAVQRAWLYSGRGLCDIACAPPGQMSGLPADFARLKDLPDAHCVVLNWLTIYYFSSDPKLALYFADQVAQLFPPEHTEGAVARIHKALLLNMLNRAKEARDCAQEVLSVTDESELSAVGFLNIALAEAWRELGDQEHALNHAETALACWQRRGSPFYCARSLSLLGSIRMKMAQFDQALRLIQQALAEFRRLEFENGIITCQLQLAEVLGQTGQWEEARVLLVEAVRLAQQRNKLWQLFHVYLSAAEIYLIAGDVDAARAHWAAAYARALQIGIDDCVEKVAHLRRAQPQLDDIQAPEHLERAKQIARKLLKQNHSLTPEDLSAAAMISAGRAAMILGELRNLADGP